MNQVNIEKSYLTVNNSFEFNININASLLLVLAVIWLICYFLETKTQQN
jgi:hypothetical protein